MLQCDCGFKACAEHEDELVAESNATRGRHTACSVARRGAFARVSRATGRAAPRSLGRRRTHQIRRDYEASRARLVGGRQEDDHQATGNCVCPGGFAAVSGGRSSECRSAYSGRPFEETFEDVNPCTGLLQTGTLVVTFYVHSQNGRIVARGDRTLSTSSGFVGTGTSSYVLNGEIEMFRFTTS